MTQAALVLAGIELMESGGRDEEVIGIMMLSNALAGDDEDDEDMALLLLAIAADEEDTTHLPDLSLRRAGLARGLCSHLFPLSSRLSGAGTPLDAGLQLLLPSFSPPPALYTLVCTRLQRGETNASFLTVRPSSADMLRQEAWPLGPSNPPSQLSPPRPRPHGPRAAGGGCPPCCHPRRGKWWSVCVCGGGRSIGNKK